MQTATEIIAEADVFIAQIREADLPHATWLNAYQVANGARVLARRGDLDTARSDLDHAQSVVADAPRS